MNTLDIVLVGGSLLVLGVCGLIFWRRLNEGPAHPSLPRGSSLQPSLPLGAALDDELRALVAQGQKIEAIKRVRAATGASLRVAKDYVEALPADHAR